MITVELPDSVLDTIEFLQDNTVANVQKHLSQRDVIVIALNVYANYLKSREATEEEN